MGNGSLRTVDVPRDARGFAYQSPKERAFGAGEPPPNTESWQRLGAISGFASPSRVTGPGTPSSPREYDPCYFWKFLDDGTRMDMVMYVDNGYVVDAFSRLADVELEALNVAFTFHSGGEAC